MLSACFGHSTEAVVYRGGRWQIFLSEIIHYEGRFGQYRVSGRYSLSSLLRYDVRQRDDGKFRGFAANLGALVDN